MRLNFGTAMRCTSDLCLMVFFLIRATPETLLGEIYIGPVPLDFFVILVGGGAEAIHVALARRCPGGNRLVGSLAISFWVMLFNGVCRQNSLKFIMVDTICVMSLAYGIFWAGSRTAAQLSSTFRFLFVSPLIVVVVFSLAGRWSGVISMVEKSTRAYTYSDFDLIFMLCTMSPLCLFFRDSALPHRALKQILSLAPVLLATVLAVSTASRAGLACSVVTAAALATLLLRSTFRICAVWAIVLGALFIGYAQLDGVHGHQLFMRLASTEVGSEERLAEVVLMLEDLEGDELFGKGLGSRFATNIDGGDVYAFAPHIGILTILHKGGVVMFMLYVVAPLIVCGLIAMASVFQTYRTDSVRHVRACFAWSVVICCTHMSMTSGWNPLYLILAAAAFSCVLRPMNRLAVEAV